MHTKSVLQTPPTRNKTTWVLPAFVLACFILKSFLAITAAADTSVTNTSPPATSKPKTSTTQSTSKPLVAGKAIPVTTLHIGTICDPATGAISGDIATRQFLSTGDKLIIYYDSNFLKSAKIAEAERHTRLYEDFNAVLGSLLSGEDKCTPLMVSKVLQFKRGTVTITGVDKDGKDAASVTVITGPIEHPFLALDLPVTNRNVLKYDTASKSLQPASSNPQLYLSLNFLWGDILSPAQSSKPWENLSLKFFIGANSTPLHSYGTGIGYRMPELEIMGFDLSSLSIYGGYFWTKQDAVGANGIVKVNGGTNHGWRFGVTYDVSSLIKSVKW